MSGLPILIGGTGGSGTRVVHALLASAGVVLGTRLNPEGDALELAPFYEEFINPTLQHTRSLNYRLDDLPVTLRDAALKKLSDALRTLRADIPGDRRWGAKNPRSLFMLPFLHALLGDFHFVHVVRDGRDLALAANQNQVVKHYETLFGEPLPADRQIAAVRMWHQANLQAQNWAQANLGAGYVLLRYEDLCRRPRESASRLLQSTDIPVTALEGPILQNLQLTTATIGRWRNLLPDRKRTLGRAATAGLAAFGYSSD